MSKCIIYGDELLPIINLGNHYVSDFVSKEEIYSKDKSPLQIGIGEKSGLAQLMKVYPPEKMYKKYWYKSHINESMREALKDVVKSASRYVQVKQGDVVLDIASNDGTLLTNWNTDVTRIGIDPSDVARNSNIYNTHKITLLNDFFSEDIYKGFTKKKSKVITIIAMFYDISNPIDFIQQVKNCMTDDGILIIQCSYTPLMLQQNAFENICHEHLAYYSLMSMKHIFDITNMKIIDVELNEVNAGSFRIYVTKDSTNENKMFAPKHVFDLGEYRTKILLDYENKMQFNTQNPYIEFMDRINNLKLKTLAWLELQKEMGKMVLGYGASTKGNTLLQYYGITAELIPFIAERSENKYGLYTTGSGIPIISEEEMRKIKPDYLFIFPWQFINTFRERERNLMESGTKLVVPLPDLKLYE